MLALFPATLAVSGPSAYAQSILTDLELSLVTDISGSVDSSEYLLQMGGYSSAFRNPSLHTAIQSGPNKSIAVNLIFFDSSASVGLDWTLLSSPSDSVAFADAIDALTRPRSGGTNPATGINLAVSGLTSNIYEGTRLVIDVSGDGAGSAFSDAAARDAALAAGVNSINGLPILGGSTTLEDYYRDNIQGGDKSFTLAADTFADYEAAVLAKLQAEILGVTPGSNDGFILSSTLRTVSVTNARVVSRDVGGRLVKLRSGVRSEPVTTMSSAPSGAKGGMAKGGMATEQVAISKQCPWEAWGQIYYSTQDLDRQTGGVTGANFLLRPDTSIDTFGGTVGVDYDFGTNWTFGLALGAANSDVSMGAAGSADIDTVALMPYVSYFQEISATSAFYVDALYGYGNTDYDTRRLPGGTAGSADGDFHTLEFNIGMNFKSGAFVHGPFGQVRYLDGTVDAYTETGPGALAFPESDYESLATQLGYNVSHVSQMANGKLVPYMSVAWEHEFEAEQGTVLGLPASSLDEDLAVIGVGIAYYMNCGWNLGLDYEARLGSDTEAHYVGLKAGVEF